MKSRETILARRAKFLSAALTCAGLSVGAEGCCPQTCLEPAMDPDAPLPMPCLTVVEESSESDAGERDATPRD
jgi:hypothetical protein